jgi:hypothetical protein
VFTPPPGELGKLSENQRGLARPRQAFPLMT